MSSKEKAKLKQRMFIVSDSTFYFIWSGNKRKYLQQKAKRAASQPPACHAERKKRYAYYLTFDLYFMQI